MKIHSFLRKSDVGLGIQFDQHVHLIQPFYL